MKVEYEAEMVKLCKEFQADKGGIHFTKGPVIFIIV